MVTTPGFKESINDALKGGQIIKVVITPTNRGKMVQAAPLDDIRISWKDNQFVSTTLQPTGTSETYYLRQETIEVDGLKQRLLIAYPVTGNDSITNGRRSIDPQDPGLRVFASAIREIGENTPIPIIFQLPLDPENAIKQFDYALDSDVRRPFTEQLTGQASVATLVEALGPDLLADIDRLIKDHNSLTVRANNDQDILSETDQARYELLHYVNDNILNILNQPTEMVDWVRRLVGYSSDSGKNLSEFLTENPDVNYLYFLMLGQAEGINMQFASEEQKQQIKTRLEGLSKSNSLPPPLCELTKSILAGLDNLFTSPAASLDFRMGLVLANLPLTTLIQFEDKQRIIKRITLKIRSYLSVLRDGKLPDQDISESE